MDEKLEEVRKRLELQIAGVSRQSAHSMMDLDAELAVMAKDVRGRIAALDKRVTELENVVGSLK